MSAGRFIWAVEISDRYQTHTCRAFGHTASSTGSRLCAAERLAAKLWPQGGWDVRTTQKAWVFELEGPGRPVNRARPAKAASKEAA